MVGSKAIIDDLVDLCIEDAIQYDPNENESQNVKTFPILNEETKRNH